MIKIFDVNPARYRTLWDQMSGNAGSFSRPNPNGTGYYTTDANIFSSVAANTAAFVNAGMVHWGEYEQVCRNSEDSSVWSNIGGCGVVDTGSTVQNFKIITVTDNGAVWNGLLFWSSGGSGSPTTRSFFVAYYQAGTSNKISVTLRDNNAGTESIYSGTIGSASVTSSAAGSVTVLNDVYNAKVGAYELCGYIDWNNPANDLNISVGPYSSDNSNINIVGADVFDDTTYRLPHVPSSGANVTVATQAGQPTYTIADLDSRVAAALGGDGAPLGSNQAPTACCTDPDDDQDNTTGWGPANSILTSIAGGSTGYCLEIAENGDGPRAYRHISVSQVKFINLRAK